MKKKKQNHETMVKCSQFQWSNVQSVDTLHALDTMLTETSYMILVQSFMDDILHTNYETMMTELMQTLEPFFNLLNNEIHKNLSVSQTNNLLKQVKLGIQLLLVFVHAAKRIIDLENGKENTGKVLSEDTILEDVRLVEMSDNMKETVHFVYDYSLMNQWNQCFSECVPIFKFVYEHVEKMNTENGKMYIWFLLIKINYSNNEPQTKDIQSLMKLRDILSLLDFDHSSTKRLQEELMVCCNQNIMYSSHAGQRFLSFVLGSLHPRFTENLMAKIRERIVALRSTSEVFKFLSQIIHTGWTLCESETRTVLEQSIEEMVELAILCEPKFASKFRRVLEGFYKKNDPATTKFVCRSFPALIYRYIPVASWKVRFNATALFSVVFPLVDVGLPIAGYESDLERQYSTWMKLMEDEHPEVRRVAVQGVCRVLYTYWEMIPTDKITSLLHCLFSKAVKDKVSPSVRAAVLQGLASVLNNPMSHITMASLIPKVSDCLDDISPIVRLAMASLLNHIAGIKDFLDIMQFISVERIFSRLVKDYMISRIETLSYVTRKFDALLDEKYKRNNAFLSFFYGGYECISSESRKTSQKLSELMIKSVFPDVPLPQQVERILLMASKFPLPLLTMVDLMSPTLGQLCCAKIAVALLNIASRRFSELCGYNKKKKKIEQVSEKDEILTCVLIRVAGRLLTETFQNLEQHKETQQDTPLLKSQTCRTKKKIKTALDTPQETLTFTNQLNTFLSSHLNPETLLSFMQGSIMIKSEALQLFFFLHYQKIDQDKFQIASFPALTTSMEEIFSQDLLKTFNKTTCFNLKCRIQTFLDIFSLIPTLSYLHTSLLDMFVHEPIKKLDAWLTLFLQKEKVCSDCDWKSQQICSNLLEQALCSFYWMYSYTKESTEYLDDTLLIDLIKKWMKCLRTLAANAVSIDNKTLFVKIPTLINNVVQLLVQKGIRVSSFKPCVHHLMEDIFNSLSYCFLCCKEENQATMDFLGYILCETTRYVLPSLVLCKAFHDKMNTIVQKDTDRNFEAKMFHHDDMVGVISHFLQQSRSSKTLNISTTYYTNVGNFSETCYMVAINVTLLALDRFVTLQPVQVFQLLEPLFLELPHASYVETAWNYFFNTSTVQRFAKIASHSLAVSLEHLHYRLVSRTSKMSLTTEDHSSTTSLKHQRLEAILTLVKRFDTTLLNKSLENSMIHCQQDAVVVVLANDGLSDTDAHTPKVEDFNKQEVLC